MSFLRPEWFLALLPLALLGLLHWRQRRGSRSWATVIDSRLLPHLLSERRGRKSTGSLLLGLLVGGLAITALAGPVWQKLSQPVFKQQGVLVIALDLSASMNAADIRPSRLERARLKLTDLLQRRKEGQTALIAYAASPFTVTPLTDDFDTILSLLPSLTTDIMPAQGSRADLAVAKAIELLDNAGRASGDILLVTDGINDTSLKHIAERHMPGIRLSLLGVGTEHGAPVRTASGEFVKHRGSIVVASSDFEQLQRLADSKDGLFQSMTIDDSDILAIEEFISGGVGFDDHQQAEFEADQWREEGPWLLLLVTPLAALAFRRGLLLPVVLMGLLLPTAAPVEAAPGWWQRLWFNPDQLGRQQLEQGHPDEAAELFEDADWKAAAHYRSGEYEQALSQLDGRQSADALYNRGNALARLGRLDEALKSYDQALEQEPAHEDAAHNRELVKQALEQQQSSGQDSSSNKDRDEEKDEQEKEQQEEEQEDKNQEGKDQEGKDQEGKDQEGKKQDGEGQQKKNDQGSSQQQGSQAQSAGQQDDRPQQGQRPDPAQQQQQGQPASEQQQQQAAGELQPDAEVQLPAERDMSQQAEQQWLRRIPDDPGGLLRNKFRYQYSRQRSAQQEEELW